MQARLERTLGQHGRLVRRDLRKACAHDICCMELFRETHVLPVVARLAREQRRIEVRQLGIHVAQRLGEQSEALAAARFDHCPDQQRVDQMVLWLRTRDRVQTPRVATRALRAEADAAAREMREHLFEVAELLARECRERRLEREPVGMPEEQIHGRPGGLLLEMRVIQQDLVEVRERARSPGRIGMRREVQHGAAFYAPADARAAPIGLASAAMQYRQLGSSGLRVSEISLGSWLTYGATVDVAGASKVVAAALELGINTFDTADVYAHGAAEEALREALRGATRHELVIATKTFFPMSGDPNGRGLSRKHICESVEASLRRLGTDYIDLHQCHRPDESVPLDETVRAYEDLIRAGKVLYWGVSEWPGQRIEASTEVADRWCAYRPISSQPQYSMLRRGIEKRVLPTCTKLGIGQIVWSPLAQGVLTGKYGTGVRPKGTRAANTVQSHFMEPFLVPKTLAKVEQLRPLAAELGITMSQLAIAWVLRQPNVASAIVGATSPEQLHETAQASGIVIPRRALEKIEALFPL